MICCSNFPKCCFFYKKNKFLSTSKLQKLISLGFCTKTFQKNLEVKALDNISVTKLLNESFTSNEFESSIKNSLVNNALKSKNNRLNPSDTSVIIFPGQGVVKVGDIDKYIMFPRVLEMFKISNEILGYNLLNLCKKGPQKLLNQTEFNQPATVLLSLAALEKLSEERPRAIESCVAVAGYSVGEIAALIFSGALNFEAGIKLIRVRANAMQYASEISPQGMLSSFCTASASVSKICEQAENWALDVGATNPVCK